MFFFKQINYKRQKGNKESNPPPLSFHTSIFSFHLTLLSSLVPEQKHFFFLWKVINVIHKILLIFPKKYIYNLKLVSTISIFVFLAKTGFLVFRYVLEETHRSRKPNKKSFNRNSFLWNKFDSLTVFYQLFNWMHKYYNEFLSLSLFTDVLYFWFSSIWADCINACQADSLCPKICKAIPRILLAVDWNNGLFSIQ